MRSSAPVVPFVVGLGGLVGAAAAGALVWACLPTLTLDALEDAGHEAGANADAGHCGDGVISSGEQCDPGPDASAARLAVCTGCQVVCNAPGELQDPVSNHCYVALPGIFTFADAGAACDEGESAHLVRFVSESELTFVASSGTTFWVGLSQQLNDPGPWFPSEATPEPGWTAACPGCFAQVEAGATSIPLDPNGKADAGLPRRCVEAEPGPTPPPWMQAVCADALGAVCEREPLGTRTVACSEGACFTVAATASAKSYALLAAPSSALGASSACATLDAGLVVFESREEREQVGYEIASQRVLDAGTDFWIGLSQGDAGFWKWARPDAGLKPQPWGAGEPNADAVPSARAWVLVREGVIDSELARAQLDAGEMHAVLCEIR